MRKQLVLILFSLALCSCQWASTQIRPDSVRSPVERVVKRHDAYTKDQQHRSESAQLLTYSYSSAIDRAKFRQLLTPVANRHDRYVRDDDQLSELQKRTYLRTTELLKQVAKRE